MTVPGSLYYSPEPIELELPWLNQQVLNFINSEKSEDRYEAQLWTQTGQRWFEVKFKRMLDVSGKFTGTIAVYTDISDRYQADRDLRQSEKRLKNIISTHIHGLVVLNQNSQIVFANPVAENLLNQKKEDLIGNYFAIDTSGKTTEIVLEKWGQVPVILQVKAVEIPWEKEMAYLISLIDITSLKQAQEKLQILYQASEQSPASIVITDAEGNIEYVNPKFEKVTGYSAEEVKGKNPRILKSGHTNDREYKTMWEKISSGQEWYGEFKNKRKNGHLFWEYASISPIKNLEGEITHFVAVKEDITQRKQNEALLEYQANYDILTALPNRILARDRLQQAITQAEQKNNQVAILLLDLDHFKQINESLGHELGDELLQEVAQRLLLCIQKSDTLARLGGDEFLILLPNVESLYDPEKIAHNILQVFKTPFHIQGEEIFISVSIGITLYPDDGLDAIMLMKNADSAMYEAKNEGRNTFKFFTPKINQQVQTRNLVQKYLRHAISQNELYMVYQPFIDLKSGSVVGAEALMRWLNPELGAVRPDQFIPIAEETGLIVELGAWALDQACAEVAQWQEFHDAPLWVAVNLSPREFRESNFVNEILGTIKRHQINTACLELEITERLLMEDIPDAKSLIEQLHDRQIRLAIDDFGTGYSSLSTLKRYPFQVLKIDRSFISEIPEDPEAVSLVKTILGMAQSLGLKSIAEGIETAEQQAFLQSLGCDYGQGYYFSKPLTAQAFRDYLRG
jgi:diguanylate cyclase (GGDEF)-like protein/PAS domain S-box-containing protein